MATRKFFILGIQSLVSSEDSTLRFGNDNTIIIPFPEGVDELHKLSINFNEKGRIAKKLLEYFTKFYCDTTATELIVPTTKTYKLFTEKYKFEKNIHIIPTGIEVERFFKENIKEDDVSDLRKRLKLNKKDFIIL